MTAFGDLVKNTTYVVQTPTCFICGKDGEVEVPMQGFLIRQLGGLIQEAYPDLSAGLREQLKTGIHPNCWQETYGSMESHA